VNKMEKGENEVYIRGEKCKIEFIKLIGTWPGGSQYVECEYKVIFEKEIVSLYLQIIKECPEYEDCLLYTSPSPRDATLSRMPSSA